MNLTPDERRQVIKIAGETAGAAIASYGASEYLTKQRASEWCGISESYLDTLTKRHGLPCHIIGGFRLWRKTEIIEFFDQHKQVIKN